MTKKTRTRSAVAATLAAVALAVVLAGCGGTSTPSESPSTIFPQSSPTSGAAGLKAYLNDVNAVLSDVSTTAGALPGAVSGMSKVPDATWTVSAAKLQDISAQLGDEAAALAALQPPSMLQPVQDAAVKGIEAAQSGMDKLATKLESKTASAATRKAKIQSTIDSLKSQIEGLSQKLSGALGGL